MFDEPIAKPITGYRSRVHDDHAADVDAARLRARLDSLRTLAENTDGLAIVDTNDLAARHQARRRRSELVLSARLLLERQARWEVPRDHRPREAAGRAGARAARVSGGDAGGDDAAATTAAARARRTPATGFEAGGGRRGSAAVEAAIAPLAGYTRDVPLRLQMAAGWKPGDSASAALWVVGELGGVADAGRSGTKASTRPRR